MATTNKKEFIRQCEQCIKIFALYSVDATQDYFPETPGTYNENKSRITAHLKEDDYIKRRYETIKGFALYPTDYPFLDKVVFTKKLYQMGFTKEENT